MKCLVIIPYGFLAKISSVVSNGSDSPSLLTALTRILYFFFGVKLVSVNASFDGPV